MTPFYFTLTFVLIAVPTLAALWLWLRGGHREAEVDELEAEMQRMACDLSKLLEQRQRDAEKIAALRRQLNEAGAPTTVRPPAPVARAAPRAQGWPPSPPMYPTLARDEARNIHRSDAFVNVALLTALSTAPAPSEPASVSSGGGDDFGGGGASGSWSDSSCSSSSDSSSSCSSGG